MSIWLLQHHIHQLKTLACFCFLYLFINRMEEPIFMLYSVYISN